MRWHSSCSIAFTGVSHVVLVSPTCWRQMNITPPPFFGFPVPESVFYKTPTLILLKYWRVTSPLPGAAFHLRSCFLLLFLLRGGSRCGRSPDLYLEGFLCPRSSTGQDGRWCRERMTWRMQTRSLCLDLPFLCWDLCFSLWPSICFHLTERTYTMST